MRHEKGFKIVACHKLYQLQQAAVVGLLGNLTAFSHLVLHFCKHHPILLLSFFKPCYLTFASVIPTLFFFC